MKRPTSLSFGTLSLLALAVALPAYVGDDSRDPELIKGSFDKVFSVRDQAPIHWTEHILQTYLSSHQRLAVRMQIGIDGSEVAKRRGEGRLIFFFQITDSRGHSYHDYTAYELEKVEAGIRASDLVCTESAFVLPGDYEVSMAIFDTATGEHAVKKSKLRAADLKNDPLPGAWRDLPTVEFIPPTDRPDLWFLPQVKGKLRLPLQSGMLQRLDVLVNLTASERTSGSYGLQDRNLGVLFPALKAVSQIGVNQTSVNVSLLDLARRRVAFRAEGIHELNWDRIKESLGESTSGRIDVKSLEARHRNAAFFLTETARRATAAREGERCAVVILSSPMEFDVAQDLESVPPKTPTGCKVFYVRYHALRSRQFGGGPSVRSRQVPGAFPGGGPRGMSPHLELDQLGSMLKPFEPRVYEVLTPDDFRKVLASLLKELSAI